MRCPAIMLQGTGSDVGKSLLAAGLCRVFARRGLRVRPFKPQNMSNNAAVTSDGGEIGRAQALQARACRVPPHSDMNPVLLKPQSDKGAQVVVQGQVRGTFQARDYLAVKSDLLPVVLDSFTRLSGEADLIVVEGAGSPAEINLRAGDIANMGFAEAAGVPVVLVGDIDRGGVIASIVGTSLLLSDSEKTLIKGFIINKFRGDMKLFHEGVRLIEKHSGFCSLGVIPWFAEAARLPAEDTVAMQRQPSERRGADTDVDVIRIAVPAFSRIANFDDLDPLIAEPDVDVAFVRPGQALPGNADLVVLPGSKSTLADLAVLRAESWDQDLMAHIRRGGHVLGLCGGFQMLGTCLDDPRGTEGPPGAAEGLGLLDIETRLDGAKTLVEARGVEVASGAEVRGYEMHIGCTSGAGLARPMLRLQGRPEGAVAADGRVQGCYLHGLFASDAFRHSYLSRLKTRPNSGLAYDSEIETILDRLADHLERHIDIARLMRVAEYGA